MDTLLAILEILEATPADYLLFACIVGVVVWEVSHRMRTKDWRERMREKIDFSVEKFHILDIAVVRLWDRLFPGEVKQHHSGDYYIQHPADKVPTLTDKE